jgi:hypothetical protein
MQTPEFPIRPLNPPAQLTRNYIVTVLWDQAFLASYRWTRFPTQDRRLEELFIALGLKAPGWLQSLLNLIPHMTKSCASDMINMHARAALPPATVIDYRAIRIPANVVLTFRYGPYWNDDRVQNLVRSGLNPWRITGDGFNRTPFIEPFLTFVPDKLPFSLLRSLRTMWLCCKRHGWHLNRDLRIRLARTVAIMELDLLRDDLFRGKNRVYKRPKLDMGDVGDTVSGRLAVTNPKARVHDALLRQDYDTVLKVLLGPDAEFPTCADRFTAFVTQLVCLGKYEEFEAMCPRHIDCSTYSYSISELPKNQRPALRHFVIRLLSAPGVARTTGRVSENVWQDADTGSLPYYAAALQQGVPYWYFLKYMPRSVFVERWHQAWLTWTLAAHLERKPPLYTRVFRQEAYALCLALHVASSLHNSGLLQRITKWLAVLHYLSLEPERFPARSIAQNRAWLESRRAYPFDHLGQLARGGSALRAADWEEARRKHELTVAFMAYPRLTK